MRIYHNQLSKNLQQATPLACLVFGDEPWQKIDSLQQIKQMAQQRGYDELIRLTADDKFDWSQLVNEFQSMSLFSSLRIIELEIPTGKVSTEGAKILLHISEQLIPDILFILHGPKIDAATSKKKWFTSIEKQGLYLPLYDIESQHLTRWLNEQANIKQLHFSTDVSAFLVEFFEGNLLALSQELEKLSLLYGKQNISYDDIESLVIKQAKFNPFQLIDVLFSKDLKKCVSILESLENEGVNTSQIIWILHKELQQLYNIKQQLKQGDNLNNIFKQYRIWDKRKPVYQQAINNTTEDNIDIALARLAQTDLISKTASDFNTFILLIDVCISLYQGQTTTHLPLNYEYA
jgi:DNA polymerase-3 subunit delta